MCVLDAGLLASDPPQREKHKKHGESRYREEDYKQRPGHQIVTLTLHL